MDFFRSKIETENVSATGGYLTLPSQNDLGSVYTYRTWSQWDSLVWKLIWEIWTQLVTTFNDFSVYIYQTWLSVRFCSITTKFKWLMRYTSPHDFPWSYGIALNTHKWFRMKKWSGASVYLSHILGIHHIFIDMLHEQLQCCRVYILHSVNQFCVTIHLIQCIHDRNCAAITKDRSMWRSWETEDGILRV